MITKLTSEVTKMPYSSPHIVMRTPQQASLFLLGHAWIGNQGARDLLELLFPEPTHVAVQVS